MFPALSQLFWSHEVELNGRNENYAYAALSFRFHLDGCRSSESVESVVLGWTELGLAWGFAGRGLVERPRCVVRAASSTTRWNCHA